MVETTELPLDHCPWCGREIDAATETMAGRTPRSGDFSLCIYCGEWNVFDHKMQLRKPTDAEFDLIAGDKIFRRARAAWLKLQQRPRRDPAS